MGNIELNMWAVSSVLVIAHNDTDMGDAIGHEPVPDKRVFTGGDFMQNQLSGTLHGCVLLDRIVAFS